MGSLWKVFFFLFFVGVDIKEGFCCLLINMGVVNIYLMCNDNVVLFELVERLRRKYG